MIDELEAKRQKRRDTREGMIRWVKGLRGEVKSESKAVLAAEAVVGNDLLGAVERVLDACADADIVDMLALCAGAHLYGELAEHIRSVQFVESEEQRAARLASPPAVVYAKLGDAAAAWLWGALSDVLVRAPRAGHPDVVAVVNALFAAIRPDVKTP
jgi:hypothetical protein